MGNYTKPNTIEDFHRNFEQLKPLMNPTMAYYESSRCLFCYDAPCIEACPTDIDIPLFIKQIKTGNLSGAARTIYTQNYFGNACGKVCPTEVLCEGACVYNHQDVKPIEIGRLQNYATQHAMDNELTLFVPGKDTGKKVAVIGAGPAGISCAAELRVYGHQVDVYEAKDAAGGLALFGTAPYKITNMEVINEVRYIKKQLGINIFYNKAITNASSIEQLEQQYDAIFLGIGLGNTRTLALDESKYSNVFGATEFIERLKTDPLNTKVGTNVVVIGGGNTAMDAASECARMGADVVTLVYRRSEKSMGAYKFELELARSVGVRTIFESRISKVLGEGTVESLVCNKTFTHNEQLENVQGSDFVLPCDMLILATGQQKQTSLLDLMQVDYDKRGRVITKAGTYQTSNPIYFCGGDALNGGAEVVNACGEAKQAARQINDFLTLKS